MFSPIRFNYSKFSMSLEDQIKFWVNTCSSKTLDCEISKGNIKIRILDLSMYNLEKLEKVPNISYIKDTKDEGKVYLTFYNEVNLNVLEVSLVIKYLEREKYF